MDVSNVMEVCRLCLDKERETIPIFEGEGVDREICLKIGSCLPVKVTSDDPLPKNICDDCTNKVELVYSFWNTTTNAEKQLLEWLGLNEPQHGTPMDLLKTEMVVLKDSDVGHSHVALANELDDMDPTVSAVDGSGEESGREEDSGGGGYQYERVSSVEPSSMDISHPSVSLTEPGPSGAQPQISITSTQPSTETTQQQKPQQQQQQQMPIPQLPDVLDSPRYSGSNENGGKREDPSGTEKEVCNICGKRYVVSLMLIHKRIHSGIVSLDCPICGIMFPSNKALRSHMVSHSDYRPYSCHVCNRTFKRNNELNMHLKIHAGVKAYQCDLCDYSCVQKSNLVVHKKRHSNEYKFKCDICDKGCYTNQELSKHKMTHMDITYKCKVCNKEFHHKYGLTIHEKKEHDPNYERPIGQFKCDVCGKSYVKFSGLKVHKRMHTGFRPYTCDVCGKSVSSRAILEVHQRTHTGEKPHICEVCGKMFTSKRYLDTHIRTHTGERPFKCKECGKCFTQHSTLIVHSRYHTGERPHECNVCGKKFVLRCQLRSHQKSSKHCIAESQPEGTGHQEEPDYANELDEHDDSLRDEIITGDIIVASTDVSEDLVVTCYEDLEASGKIIFSCSTCKKIFSDKNKLITHQKKSCTLNDQIVKPEPGSDSD